MPMLIAALVLAGLALLVSVLLGLLFHPVNTLRWITLQAIGVIAVALGLVGIGTWLQSGLLSSLGWFVGAALASLARHRISLAW